MAFPFLKPAIIDLYHLTNKHNYKKIIKSNALEPNSHPFWRMRLDKGESKKILEEFGVNFNHIWRIMKSNRFILCFEEPFPRGWTNSGLMRYIINHVENKSAFIEYSGGPIYSFHINANPYRVFVRDHWYTSPEYYKRKFGRDYWVKFIQSTEKKIPFREIDHIREIADGVADYLKSTIPYSHYHRGKYKAPEFWYAARYDLEPFDGIKQLSWRGVRTLRG